MTDQDNLRERMAEAFKRGADGYGGVEGGAQAIIDEFGLQVVEVDRIELIDHTVASYQIVGQWEKR